MAVNDIEELARVPSSLRREHKTMVSALAGAGSTAFVVDCPSLESTALWVGKANNHYREDYLCHLKSIYELGLQAVPAPYDVDRLYNRSGARNYALKFIRMVLVDRASNQSHGASYEKT